MKIVLSPENPDSIPRRSDAYSPATRSLPRQVVQVCDQLEVSRREPAWVVRVNTGAAASRAPVVIAARSAARGDRAVRRDRSSCTSAPSSEKGVWSLVAV